MEAALAVPAAQAVQDVAPAFTGPFPDPISATEPAEQVWHPREADVEYVPAPQAVHVVAPLLTAPVPAPISAMDPTTHTPHDVAPAEPAYVPVEHALQACVEIVL